MRCREKNVRDEEGVIDEDRSVVGRPFVTIENLRGRDVVWSRFFC